MPLSFFADKTFSQTDFNKTRLLFGEYESCDFKGCSFANTDLSGIQFRECSFLNCDFSNATVTDASITASSFEGCKLIGVRFNECNNFLFSPAFIECNLDFSSFFALELKNGVFKNCSLVEADFSEAVLTGANFENCNLERASFYNTNLQKANLKTSINFTIDPENNNIAKAIFSLENCVGLLAKYNIAIE